MQSSDPGFNKDNLVVMEMRDTTFKKGLDAFKQELVKNPDIKGIAFSNGNPGYDININVMRIEGDSGMMVDRAINNFFADYDYASLMGLEIVEGRYYNREMKTDPEKAFVINETAARKFGWVDSVSRSEGNYASAIGKRMQWGINPNGNVPLRDGLIVGVVKDFHYGSMRNPIEPLVILLDGDNRNAFFANIRIDGKHKQKTVDYINQTRQEFKDIYPFKYSFIDEKMKDYYSAEKRISMLARTFAILTIIIAALGLFGLSSFLTQTRTREIGIRKISGASASNIVLMFAREFAGWILLANAIAAPVTILLLKKWLEVFPYKTAIHATIFISGLVITLAIALITVSFRVIQAASTNPAEAIRYS
jgi:putative ABC transport system permease protein